MPHLAAGEQSQSPASSAVLYSLPLWRVTVQNLFCWVFSLHTLLTPNARLLFGGDSRVVMAGLITSTLQWF